MDIYFDTVPDYYESVKYISRIYKFFGSLSTHLEDLMVPIINSSIQDSFSKILNPRNKCILDPFMVLECT